MTDVEFTVEGCDHSLTPKEARRLARELNELATAAEALDASKPSPIRLKNGYVTLSTVQAVMAHEYDAPNQRQLHTGKLWRDLTSRVWIYKVHCLACKRRNTMCCCDKRYDQDFWGIPAKQILGHESECRSKLAPRTNYCALEKAVRQLLIADSPEQVSLPR